MYIAQEKKINIFQEYYKEITSSAAVVKYSEYEEDVVYAGKHNEQMVEGVRHLHLNVFYHMISANFIWTILQKYLGTLVRIVL